jgi:hypothetical protein
MIIEVALDKSMDSSSSACGPGTLNGIASLFVHPQETF